MNWSNISLNQVVQLVQIAFYLTGGCVAILTYRSAKRGLLNTVNTEYKKKVIERLQELSEELASEFDSSSPNYWAGSLETREIFSSISAEFLANKEEILKKGEFMGGAKMPERYKYLSNLVGMVKSDPFIPKKIRDTLVDLLANRASVITGVYIEVISDYRQELARGNYNETLDSNWGWLHNRINDKLYERGCGVSQVENEVHNVRLAIQNYFESFDPIQ